MAIFERSASQPMYVMSGLVLLGRVVRCGCVLGLCVAKAELSHVVLSESALLWKRVSVP